MLINNNIKNCREIINISQKELGKILGVSNKTISGWETGADFIPLKKLIQFCNKFNINVDYALGLTSKNVYNGPIELNNSIISKNLKNLRRKNNLSQIQISRILKISQSCYSQYESGKNLPNTAFLYVLASTFKISVNSILRIKKSC